MCMAHCCQSLHVLSYDIWLCIWEPLKYFYSFAKLAWTFYGLACITSACKLISWMNPTPYTHAFMCPFPYASHVHAYMSSTCMHVSMFISPHDLLPCPMEHFKRITNFSFLFNQICPTFLSIMPSRLHACHLLHGSPTTPTFCTCSHPPFHTCFLFLFATCLIWGGIFGVCSFFSFKTHFVS